MKRTSPSWGQCKAAIAKWPQPGLVALIQELYRLSDDNRRFLHGRVLPQKSEATLAEAKKKIKQMVSTRQVFGGGISQRELKRIIDQFDKAVDNPVLVARLLVVDIAVSCETFSEVGDYDAMVDHIYASMRRLDQCLEICDKEPARQIIAELDETAQRWEGSLGYGISDELVAMAADWKEKLVQKADDAPQEV